MTKRKTTKHALLMSGLALLLCISMLVGSTYAWFTDSVTSAGNIIKSGMLQIEMFWANGKDDPNADTTVWTDASTGAMFTNDLWEPGYVEARHISIANVGTLALKYQMRLLANGVTSVLANVIDVYYFDTATQLDRTTVKNGTKLGTLAQVLNNMPESTLASTFKGELESEDSKLITIALVMQETAGNEYQGLSIGSDFAVQVIATQLTSEKDSFNEFYDKGADFAPQETPKAMVFQLDEATTSKIDVNGIVGLDTAYSFQPTETYGQAEASEYVYDHADFFVYADNTVPADSMVLAGYYSAFGSWLGLSNEGFEVKPGAENGIRLINDGLRAAGFNVTVAYSDICLFGNDGIGFLCGAKDLTGKNAGTTLTVELRLYDVACDDAGCHHDNPDCETGEYITVGKFTYTFPYEVVNTAAELKAALESGKSITLGQNIDLSSVAWTPVGTATEPYSGTFDGNGKTISGLTVSSGDFSGLFGYVSDATIKNLNLADVNVSGGERMGALIGQVNGNAVISDCTVSGSVVGSNSNTGGLIGEIIKGTVQLTNLTNNASVTNTSAANSRAGGVVGQVTTNANVTLKNCTNNGKVTTNNGYAGGIVSAYQSGTLTIDNCTNNGELEGQYEGNMLGWYTSVRSITISSASNAFDVNAIGCVDIATSSDMALYGKHYFVNKMSSLTGITSTKQSFSEIFAAENIGTSPKALWDKLIAFYAHAAETNKNFEGYPDTYWKMFDKDPGYSDPDWNSYFISYNAQCGAGNELEKSEFSSASWREHIVYLAPEA